MTQDDLGVFGVNRELLKVCGISFFHFVAVDLLAPLVPQYAARLNLVPALIGILISSYAFIPFLLAVPGGALTDRFGTRRMLVVGVSTVIVGGLVFAVSNSTALLFAAEILTGLGHFIVMVSIQAHVSLLAIDKDQGFGMFTFASALGTTVGPILGGLVAENMGFAPAFLTAAVSASLGAILVSRLREVSTSANGRRISLRDSGEHLRGFIANRGILMAMFGSIAMLFAMGLLTSFYPLYLEGRGMTPASIGLLIGTASAAATVVRLGLFRGIKHWGRRPLFAAALVLGALGIGLVPLMGTFGFLAIAAVMAGLGKGMSQPLSMILVANSTRDEERGLAMGFRLMGNRLGGFLSPLVLGFIVTYFSMQTLFYVTALVPLTASLVVVAWIRSRPKPVVPRNLRISAD